MKKKQFLTYFLIALTIGFLVLYYTVVYLPFETRKSFIYIKSDFILTEADVANLDDSLSKALSDNTQIIDHSSLYSQIVNLNSSVISNSEYIKKAGSDNTEIGVLLLNYYSEIKSVTDVLKPRIAFAAFEDKLDLISSTLDAQITSTDNYDVMAIYVETSLSQIDKLEETLANNVISDYPEVKEIASEYISDIKSYYSQMIPLINSVPEYLAKNDRDQSRAIMAQIDALSSQFKGNETNLDRMAFEYFNRNDDTTAASIKNILILQNEIASKLSSLSI
jgi:hypothetical protein